MFNASSKAEMFAIPKEDTVQQTLRGIGVEWATGPELLLIFIIKHFTFLTEVPMPAECSFDTGNQEYF